MTVLTKPAHGTPCNGCGLCCQAVLCPLARDVFGAPSERPCPALTPKPDGPGYDCGLVVDPARFVRADTEEARMLSETALVLIGAGFACDASLVEEPRDSAWEKRLAKHRLKTRPVAKAARAVWRAAIFRDFLFKTKQR